MTQGQKRTDVCYDGDRRQTTQSVHYLVQAREATTKPNNEAGDKNAILAQTLDINSTEEKPHEYNEENLTWNGRDVGGFNVVSLGTL